MAEMWDGERFRLEVQRLERGQVPISREVLHQALMAFAHPLSPFDDLDSKDRLREPWYGLADESWLDLLVDLAENPPLEDKRHPAFEEVWDIELADLIIQSGRRDPAACVERLRPLLLTAEGRAVAIFVIARLGTPDQRERHLAPLLVSFTLSEDEVMNLAEAVMGTPTPSARAHLQSIRAFLARDRTETLEYLEAITARHEVSPG